MSMTAKQSETYQRLTDALYARQGGAEGMSKPNTYFIEQPKNDRDYGTPPHVNMRCEVLRITEDGKHCIEVGWLSIKPDGTYTCPAVLQARLLGEA